MSSLPSSTTGTAVSTIRGDLARFDAQQRALATAHGKPAYRMAGASIPRRDSIDPSGANATFFWVHNGALVCGKPQGDIAPATPQRIAAAVLIAGEMAVALTTDVSRRMVRMMGTLPPWTRSDTADMLRLRQAQRLVAFYSTLPVSSHLVTLTEALDRKFYLPTGIDTSSIADWRGIFNVAQNLAGLGDLLAKAFLTGLDPKQYGNKTNDPTAALLRAEQVAEKQAEFSGASSKASLLNCAEAISEAWSGVIRTDRIARRRGVIDGSVCRITPVKRNGGKILATVSAPFKLKEGDLILMDDDAQSDRIGYASLFCITVEDDALLVEFGPLTDKVQRNVGSFSMLDGAMAAHTTMLVTAKPFLGGGRPVFAGNWGRAADPAAEPITRRVPLDVVLAGVPVSS